MQHTQPENERGPESATGYWINRASRLLVRLTDARLRPFGLAMSHLPVLRALADGSTHSQTELARIAVVEQPSMAETLARMERDGVITRQANPADKRSTLVALTRRSRARFPKAAAALREAERDAMAALSDDERELLRGLLKRVVATLEAQEPDEPPGTSSSVRRSGSSTSTWAPTRRRP